MKNFAREKRRRQNELNTLDDKNVEAFTVIIVAMKSIREVQIFNDSFRGVIDFTKILRFMTLIGKILTMLLLHDTIYDVRCHMFEVFESNDCIMLHRN
jgi:hypothetical protein